VSVFFFFFFFLFFFFFFLFFLYFFLCLLSYFGLVMGGGAVGVGGGGGVECGLGTRLVKCTTTWHSTQAFCIDFLSDFKASCSAILLVGNSPRSGGGEEVEGREGREGEEGERE